MINFATSPLCREYEQHEAHPIGDRVCRVMSAEVAEVRKIVTMCLGLKHLLDVTCYGQPVEGGKLRVHPRIFNAMWQEIIPDYGLRDWEAKPEIGIPVEVDTSLADGEWRLSVAEGKIG